MPKRVPVQSVVVSRDKKIVTPPIGEPFDFTDAEIEQIEKANPAALSAMAQVDLTKEPAVTEKPKADAGKGAAAAGGEL